MSYLARLKTLLAEKRLPDELTELTKGASVSFVSDQGSRFSGNEAAERIRAYPCSGRVCACPVAEPSRGGGAVHRGMGRAGVGVGLDGSRVVCTRRAVRAGQSSGAAWFVGGSTVAAVAADAITLRTIAGSTLRLYRRGCLPVRTSPGKRTEGALLTRFTSQTMTVFAAPILWYESPLIGKRWGLDMATAHKHDVPYREILAEHWLLRDDGAVRGNRSLWFDRSRHGSSVAFGRRCRSSGTDCLCGQ